MAAHLMPLICSPWLYVIVFLAVAIDGFLPVVPSEAVVIGLSALSAAGSPHPLWLAVAVVAGGVTGDRVASSVAFSPEHRLSWAGGGVGGWRTLSWAGGGRATVRVAGGGRTRRRSGGAAGRRRGAGSAAARGNRGGGRPAGPR